MSLHERTTRITRDNEEKGDEFVILEVVEGDNFRGSIQERDINDFFFNSTTYELRKNSEFEHSIEDPSLGHIFGSEEVSNAASSRKLIIIFRNISPEKMEEIFILPTHSVKPEEPTDIVNPKIFENPFKFDDATSIESGIKLLEKMRDKLQSFSSLPHIRNVYEGMVEVATALNVESESLPEQTRNRINQWFNFVFELDSILVTLVKSNSSDTVNEFLASFVNCYNENFSGNDTDSSCHSMTTRSRSRLFPCDSRVADSDGDVNMEGNTPTNGM